MPKATISRCGGTTGTYAATVASIGAAGTLRGYWRLGESASPWLDTSGWASGPTDLTLSGAGAVPTAHVGGALPGSQDDGAIQINGGPATGQYLQNGLALVNTGINTSWTIAAWVKPFASVSNWIAAVYENSAPNAGLNQGWRMAVVWSGGAVSGYLQRFINNAPVNAAVGIPTGAFTYLVGTYDGATLSLYSNGALVSTAADARADTFDPYNRVDLGVAFADPFQAVGRISGVLDEVAIWGAVLTLANVQTLYAAGTT